MSNAMQNSQSQVSCVSRNQTVSQFGNQSTGNESRNGLGNQSGLNNSSGGGSSYTESESMNEAHASLLQLLDAADQMIQRNMIQLRNEILERQIPLMLEQSVARAVRARLGSKIEEMIDNMLPELMARSLDKLPTMVANAIHKALGEAGTKTLPLLAQGNFVCARPCGCPSGCRGVPQ